MKNDAKPTTNFTGGKLIVPSEEEENRIISQKALKFTDTCEADEHGGKTIWIGIQPDERGRWLVSTFDMLYLLLASLKLFRYT